MVRKAIIAVLFVISISINLFLSYSFVQQYKVVEVVDGDTFQLSSGKRVRLMGVDAPEYNRCGGPEAKKLLSSLILNKYVFLAEEQQETFGRSLALTYTEKGLVNKVILEEGWGRPDYRKNSQRDVLTAAFHKASDSKIGIYSSLCRTEASTTTNPQDCYIKGNIDKNSYKKYYHLPECKQYNQIVLEKDIGEQCFKTEAEAVKAGFVKSAGCPKTVLISNVEPLLTIPINTYIACDGDKEITQLAASQSASLYPIVTGLKSCLDIDKSNPQSPRTAIYLSQNKSSSTDMNEFLHCFTSEAVPLSNAKVQAVLVNINDTIVPPVLNVPLTECFPVTGGYGTAIYVSFENSTTILYLGGEKKELLNLMKDITFTAN